jgi:hypothetical protein
MEYYRLTIPIPKQPWLWIRFRIVTLLLLVAIAALALAWRRDHQKLSQQLYQLQNPGGSWGINQVIGAPNTTGPGDITTAWASATQDGQKEWMILEYANKVVPKAIVVHETYNPGAVVKATHYPKWGKEEILWQGADPTPTSAGAGVSRLPLKTAIKTGRIKLYIDSPAVAGWNEIDAVGLELDDGTIIWAENATASSSYGSRSAPSLATF